MNLGPVEIAFVLGIVLLLFGPDKIPDLARSIGKATREYQNALKGINDSGNSVLAEMKGESSATNTSTATSSATSPEDYETKIMKQAQALGINTSGKTVDQVVDEILARSDEQ